MQMRRGEVKDIESIMDIIKAAIVDMESREIYQWDDIYPNEEVIYNDINEGSLYIYEDGENIKAIIVLNQDQDKQYESLEWKNKGKALIIHRLCVHPKYQGQGIAKALIQYAEEYAKKNNYESIRFDAFIQHERACNVYERAGYAKVGIVSFRKGDFYCFEKGI